MDWGSVQTVLKWILLVIAAGFIGQFGKALAIYLLERRRRRRAAAEATDAVPNAQRLDRGDRSVEDGAAQAKIEKKRAKAEVKRLKKS